MSNNLLPSYSFEDPPSRYQIHTELVLLAIVAVMLLVISFKIDERSANHDARQQIFSHPYHGTPGHDTRTRS